MNMKRKGKKRKGRKGWNGTKREKQGREQDGRQRKKEEKERSRKKEREKGLCAYGQKTIRDRIRTQNQVYLILAHCSFPSYSCKTDILKFFLAIQIQSVLQDLVHVISWYLFFLTTWTPKIYTFPNFKVWYVICTPPIWQYAGS